MTAYPYGLIIEQPSGAFLTVSRVGGTGTTSVVVNNPSSWLIGNTLVAWVVAYGTTTVPTAPAGWSQITSITNNVGQAPSGEFGLLLALRSAAWTYTSNMAAAAFLLNLSAAGGASYTFTTTGASAAQALILEYNSWLAATVPTSATDSGHGTSSLSFNSVTTGQPNEVVLLLGGVGGGSANVTTWPTNFIPELSMS